MSKAKGLFYLMAERSSNFTPCGFVTVNSLAVELAAGGISPENVGYVIFIQKFSIRQNVLII